MGLKDPVSALFPPSTGPSPGSVNTVKPEHAAVVDKTSVVATFETRVSLFLETLQDTQKHLEACVQQAKLLNVKQELDPLPQQQPSQIHSQTLDISLAPSGISSGHKIVPAPLDISLPQKRSHVSAGIESNSPPRRRVSLHARSYPLVKDWLQRVDEDSTRNNQIGDNGASFSDLSDIFNNNGVIFINQLVNWDYKMLIDKPFDMLIGPAKDLLGWVQEDVAAFEAGYSV